MSRGAWFLTLLLLSVPALADPMSDYRAGSGFGTGDLLTFFKTLFFAGIGVYGVWAIGTGVWSWVHGSTDPMHLFFIVFRSALIMVVASTVVTMLV